METIKDYLYESRYLPLKMNDTLQRNIEKPKNGSQISKQTRSKMTVTEAIQMGNFVKLKSAMLELPVRTLP